jgi:putative membrane protein
MTWWCSATGLPWSWVWRPYPGVWLLVAAIVTGYVLALRRRRPDPLAGDDPRLPRRRIISFAGGVLALWIAADWPVGALGAGYLVSLHTVQYLLFTLAAPPLLLYGMPPWLLRRLLRPRSVWRVARAVTRPVAAFAVFNVVMLGTHLPAVVDGLGGSQLGSFAVDMAWLGSGLVFWWPVTGPLPELGRLSDPARILFLILNVFIPTVPASFLTFADYPLYALYELAPSVGGVSAATDQQVAGLLMKLVGGLVIFGAATVLFFRWHGREPETGSVIVSREP